MIYLTCEAPKSKYQWALRLGAVTLCASRHIEGRSPCQITTPVAGKMHRADNEDLISTRQYREEKKPKENSSQQDLQTSMKTGIMVTRIHRAPAASFMEGQQQVLHAQPIAPAIFFTQSWQVLEPKQDHTEHLEPPSQRVCLLQTTA